MEEVTNMLQRIRELAVQSANGTMNSSDRFSLDAEVQALRLKSIALQTPHSSTARTFWMAATRPPSRLVTRLARLALNASVQTKDLGMGAGAALVASI